MGRLNEDFSSRRFAVAGRTGDENYGGLGGSAGGHLDGKIRAVKATVLVALGADMVIPYDSSRDARVKIFLEYAADLIRYASNRPVRAATDALGELVEILGLGEGEFEGKFVDPRRGRRSDDIEFYGRHRKIRLVPKLG